MMTEVGSLEGKPETVFIVIFKHKGTGREFVELVGANSKEEAYDRWIENTSEAHCCDIIECREADINDIRQHFISKEGWFNYEYCGVAQEL